MRQIQNILFINPPEPGLLDSKNDTGYSYFEPPLGLLYVYSHMKQKKTRNAVFLDLNTELKNQQRVDLHETLDTIISKNKPDVVALSALYYAAIPVFHEVVNIIKRIDADIVTVLGGHYPTHMTDKCMADPHVDYAVLSEGEIGFSDLMDALDAGTDLADVEGIAYRKDGRMVMNPRTHFWKGYGDSERLPWEDTDFPAYFKNSRHVLHRLKPAGEFKIAAITATRGCPNDCTFCSSPKLWKRRWRKRTVSGIIDEISYLQKTYGINTIVFNDENMTVHKAWLLELLDGLTRLDITWIAGAGLSIRSINDAEIIERMYESGVGLFNLAIESSTNANLKRINKNLTIEETTETIDLIRTHGNAYITGFFISGFPWETMADVNYTLAYAESLDLDWKCFYCFQPFPGSELYDYCIDHQLMDDFNPAYKENYLAPDLKHIDYTSDDLEKVNYLANLRFNFVNNRNIRVRTRTSLDQAERDFHYVLSMAKGHVFALMGMAQIHHLRNNVPEKEKYLNMAQSALASDAFDWTYYLQKLQIAPDDLLIRN